jgi:hypothetical protein
MTGFRIDDDRPCEAVELVANSRGVMRAGGGLWTTAASTDHSGRRMGLNRPDRPSTWPHECLADPHRWISSAAVGRVG